MLTAVVSKLMFRPKTQSLLIRPVTKADLLMEAASQPPSTWTIISTFVDGNIVIIAPNEMPCPQLVDVLNSVTFAAAAQNAVQHDGWSAASAQGLVDKMANLGWLVESSVNSDVTPAGTCRQIAARYAAAATGADIVAALQPWTADAPIGEHFAATCAVSGPAGQIRLVTIIAARDATIADNPTAAAPADRRPPPAPTTTVTTTTFDLDPGVFDHTRPQVLARLGDRAYTCSPTGSPTQKESAS